MRRRQKSQRCQDDADGHDHHAAKLCRQPLFEIAQRDLHVSLGDELRSAEGFRRLFRMFGREADLSRSLRASFNVSNATPAMPIA
jgi:hypothetical protein